MYIYICSYTYMHTYIHTYIHIPWEVKGSPLSYSETRSSEHPETLHLASIIPDCTFCDMKANGQETPRRQEEVDEVKKT